MKKTDIRDVEYFHGDPSEETLTAEDYYEATRKYFEAKERGTKPHYEEYHEVGSPSRK